MAQYVYIAELPFADAWAIGGVARAEDLPSALGKIGGGAFFTYSSPVVEYAEVMRRLEPHVAKYRTESGLYKMTYRILRARVGAVVQHYTAEMDMMDGSP
jgi:hypothetical protein